MHFLNLVENLLLQLEERNYYLLSSVDKFGASLFHYACALNLHEILGVFALKGISLNEKVKNTNETPLIIASLCGNEETV